MLKSVFLIQALFLAISLCVPRSAFAMHIMEGFLPPAWAGLWYILMLPFLAIGLRSMRKRIKALGIFG